MKLSPTDFEYIRTVLRTHSAIALDDSKAYLVETRLDALARREGFPSIATLVHQLRVATCETLRAKVVEAMTTNETSFFRDLHPFEALRKTLLPQLIERRVGPRRLRIWCAACSSGQEPVSVALLIRNHFPEIAGWDVRIHATDISAEMVERTRRARYSQLEINRGLPAAMLLKYFERDGLEWTANDAVRSLIDAHVLNLAGAWPVLEMFDLILMRNVLIYFDHETKRRILARLTRTLRADGYLLLGGTETTLNLDDSFERIDLGRCGAYSLRPREISSHNETGARTVERRSPLSPSSSVSTRPDVRGIP